MRNSHVLVVEDESEIRELICLHLLRQGYKVQEAASGEEAIARLRNDHFDLVIVDWMLPQASGIDIVQNMRKQTGDQQTTPVLMVTAKADPEDVVKGLDNGADDYLVKPFDPSVLMARVRALLRRKTEAATATSADIIKISGLEINKATYEVFCSSEKLQLTPSEYKLLLTMAENTGRVLTREKLIESIQGEGINVVGRTVDTHVFGLRKKMGACADCIETIRGVGYRVIEG